MGRHALSKVINLTGRTFGKLFVIEQSKRPRHWSCKCACGKVRDIRYDHLLGGHTTGCRSCSSAFATHRQSKTTEYILWLNAKMRAKKRGVPFTIHWTDVAIPERCPLLGIPLERGTRSVYTASLDQLRPGVGYVPGNVWVISWRANQIKSNLTLAQLEAFVSTLRTAHG